MLCMLNIHGQAILLMGISGASASPPWGEAGVTPLEGSSPFYQGKHATFARAPESKPPAALTAAAPRRPFDSSHCDIKAEENRKGRDRKEAARVNVRSPGTPAARVHIVFRLPLTSPPVSRLDKGETCNVSTRRAESSAILRKKLSLTLLLFVLLLV